MNFADPFGLKLEFRGEDRADLEASYRLGLIALRIGAERGDKAAAFYLRELTKLEKNPNRTIVIESGRTTVGGLGETDPGGNRITIDVAGAARELNTRFSLLLLHELGHAYGMSFGRSGGEGEALDVENAARRALGFREREDHGSYPPIAKRP